MASPLTLDSDLVDLLRHTLPEFEARAKTSGMIIASQDPRFAREFCDIGLVLANGQARLFHNLERALAFAERAARPSKTPEDRRAARKKSRKRRERRKASDE